MQISVIKNSAIILAVRCLDRDGNPVVLSEAVKDVLFTVRKTEASPDFLIQKWGEVEYRGDADNAAVVAVELMPEDYSDPVVPEGSHRYDFWVREKGAWFDFDVDEYDGGVYYPFKYGAVRVDKDSWIDVEAGLLALSDGLNFIQVSDHGVVTSEASYDEDKRKIKRVFLVDGDVLQEWPRDDWFGHSLYGLAMSIDGGFVIDWENNALLEVDGETVQLDDNAVNYIQVDIDTQDIVSNTTGWVHGKPRLFKVSVDDGYVDVEVQDKVSAIKDDRTIYTRGDRFFCVGKDAFNVLSSVTTLSEFREKFEEIEEVGS